MRLSPPPLTCLLAVALIAGLAGPSAADAPPKAKIVLVGTRPDHPYASHMYMHECGLLAKCLRQTPGIEAVVAEEWPDAHALEGARAIVFYSRPAGDIVLGPHRDAFRKLMDAGVGYVAIHWATDAAKDRGAEYLDVLGGWFNTSFAGLKTTRERLVQAEPTHPICRGWKDYDSHEEFYLNLKFHPKARPLVTATVDGKQQVVAWTFERPGGNGGRSFGTTLGHFHDCFAREPFRRLLVNGILWSAGLEVPDTGAPVTVTAADLELPPPPPAEKPVFEPGAKLKVEAAGGAGGEGPAWHPELGVLSSGNNHINQLTRDGKSRIWRKDAGTNGLLFDHQGRLVACESEGRRVTRTEPDGKVVVLTDRYQGKRYNTPNDLTIDVRGRIYFSDPRYGNREGMEILDDEGRTIEGVYRIDPDGTVRRVIGRELERPNGVLVSADGRFLYVADNNNNAEVGARKLWRFNLKTDGSLDLASKKRLHDWSKGRGPDGLKQDREGRLYVAAGLNKPNPPFEPDPNVKGGIYVLSPEGKRLAFIAVPTDEVTNCAFGGDDLRTLYITGGGTLYSIRTTTPGFVTWPAK